jgi:hypothetical protein
MIGRTHQLLIAGALLAAAVVAIFVFILADEDPPAEGAGMPSGCTWELPYVVCKYTASTNMSVDQMVTDIEGDLETQVATSTPVWVQAWGGGGGNGAEYLGASNSKGEGGTGGYASTISSVGKLQGQSLYVYVSRGGTHGDSTAGSAGSSSIVSTQLLSKMTSFPGGLLVVAGGGGGGGKACSDAKGGDAGDAGVAVGGSGSASGAGGNGNGYGGNPGKGGNSDGHGAGGAGGSGYGAGTSGLGGTGGGGSGGEASVGWNDLGAVDSGASSWGAGTGAYGSGGGGGGYGGGGGGNVCTHSGFHSSGGGGGGGSYAIANALSDSNAPSGSKQGTASNQVILTFHLG